ncbi:PspC domain-containing protein [Oceanivirga miroungae]|uniref:Phage shock protein C n=1 Tax=Oceanivirga miroungae TaxID=1130046 RepID=A0A6I8ME07_9FUSO|nr:PspC domain-containing protein [Oceanivirga miroungae]VWL85331.1 phage shock protein C [Oceanivirga miroungae]
MRKKLYRNTDDMLLFGVCSGIADYFNVDPLIIRILFVFIGGTSLLYIVLALLMPVKPKGRKDQREFDYEEE